MHSVSWEHFFEQALPGKLCWTFPQKAWDPRKSPVKRLASSIQSTSALQTSGCITTLLTYRCQSKRGMTPPWLCVSPLIIRLRLCPINTAGMSPVLREQAINSTKLSIDSGRVWKTEYHAASWLSTLLMAGDSRWVCQGEPYRGHGTKMLLAVSKRYLLGSAWHSIMWQ